MAKRIVIGISGASGVTYAVRMLEVLRETKFETHLVISNAGRLNIEIETTCQPAEVEAMANFVYEHKDMAASISSGSFLTEAMVVIPCTIKSLSGIANSYLHFRKARSLNLSSFLHGLKCCAAFSPIRRSPPGRWTVWLLHSEQDVPILLPGLFSIRNKA